MSEPRFVSEPIAPLRGTFDTAAIARGEPGLPEGFTWRGTERRIDEILEAGKLATPEFSGELYVRRHEWKLRMDDGSVWDVYVTRNAPKGASRRARLTRWFLKTRRDEASS